jgi:hypothetical protein
MQSEYGGVQDVRVTPDKIWMPDILLYDSSSSSFDPTYHVNIVLSADGFCSYIPPGIFMSTCALDMTWDVEEKKPKLSFSLDIF